MHKLNTKKYIFTGFLVCILKVRRYCTQGRIYPYGWGCHGTQWPRLKLCIYMYLSITNWIYIRSATQWIICSMVPLAKDVAINVSVGGSNLVTNTYFSILCLCEWLFQALPLIFLLFFCHCFSFSPIFLSLF